MTDENYVRPKRTEGEGFQYNEKKNFLTQSEITLT